MIPATAANPKAPYASRIKEACRLASAFENSGFGPCGGSSEGIKAKIPMANSTGDANAPRNHNRDHTPTTRYTVTIVQITNVVAS